MLKASRAAAIDTWLPRALENQAMLPLRRSTHSPPDVHAVIETIGFLADQSAGPVKNHCLLKPLPAVMKVIETICFFSGPVRWSSETPMAVKPLPAVMKVIETIGFSLDQSAGPVKNKLL